MKNVFGLSGSAGILVFLMFFSVLELGACSRQETMDGEPEGIKGETVDSGVPVIALYGFSRDDPRFKDKSGEEILDILRRWKINAVFGAHKDKELAAVLRNGGIRLYAEFGVFAGEHFWTEFPGSRPVTSEGKLLEKIDWYAAVNPSCEQVRQERLQSFAEILENYPLDGIWLDFIRWPGRWENPEPQLLSTSFDAPTLQKFSRDTGIELDIELGPRENAQVIGTRYREEWAAWRCRQVTGWVAEAREIVNKEFPEIQLGLFGVPWTNDFDNAIIGNMGQDYQALGEYIDVFSPMVYHLMCGRNVAWISEVAAWVQKTSGQDVLPIIQTVDEPGELSADEFGEAVRDALGSPGSKGVILFNLQGLDDRKIKAAGIALEQ